MISEIVCLQLKLRDAEQDKTIGKLIESNNKMAIGMEKLEEKQLLLEGTSGGGYKTPSDPDDDDDDDDAGKKDWRLNSSKSCS